jgi:hypothetical protein
MKDLHDASPTAARDACAWCKSPIPSAARRDSICCSVRCRQARHRFTSAVGQASRSAGEPLRLAYADPPYPGRAARYYGDHPDYAGEVDHAELIGRLSAYDGWALSTSADALQQILALCPAGVRVAAWHRGERPTRSARPLNAWEPVIYFGGRAVVEASATASVVEDLHDASGVATRDASCSTAVLRDASLSAVGDAYSPGQGDASRSAAARRLDSLVFPARARRTDPLRVIGSKPAVFCRWIFDLLGAQIGDEFEDLFPGSGGVARAWESFIAGAA